MHSDEPWKATPGPEGDDLKTVISSDAVRLITFIYPVHTGWVAPSHEGIAEGRANAARIVACVNACRGIPTEALEAGVIQDLILTAVDCRTLAAQLDKTDTIAAMDRLLDNLKGVANVLKGHDAGEDLGKPRRRGRPRNDPADRGGG
jgi:hypothetical protein